MEYNYYNQFIKNCVDGNLKRAKMFYSLCSVSINDAFCKSCENGHLDVAKWLYSLGNINIHMADEYAFRASCQNGHLDVAKWLASIYKMYSITIQNNKIIEWKILSPIDIYLKNCYFS